MTAKFTIHTFITFILISKVFALTALQGSPCYDTCDGGQQTSGADVVCLDQDFDNSTKGGILQKCLKCLQRSNFKSGTMSDSTLFLYYLASVQQTCLSNPKDPISKCSANCTDIPTAFAAIGGKALFAAPWSFCTAGNNTFLNEAPGCAKCLQSQSNTVTLGNFVFVSNIGCEAEPNVANGEAIYQANDLFNTDILGNNDNSTSSTIVPSPTPTPTAASSTSSAPSSTSSAAVGQEGGSAGGLSRGAAAAIGLILGVLGIAGIVALALFARKRMVQKQTQGPSRPWQKMDEKPNSARPQTAPAPSRKPTSWAQTHHNPHSSLQATSVAQSRRGPTPPAAGVFVPPPVPSPAAANSRSKSMKSLKSMGSKSIRSIKNWTPRTSAFHAANPRKSVDLTSLPQKGWD